MQIYLRMLAFCVLVLRLTSVGALAQNTDPYAEVTISNPPPCNDQPVTFIVTTRNIIPGSTYEWKFNDVVQDARGTTFTFPNNSKHYLNQYDYIVCTITPPSGFWTAGVLTAVKSYGTQQANIRIYPTASTLNLCKGAALQLSYDIIRDDNPTLRWDLTWQVNGVDVAAGTGPGATIDFPANYEVYDGDKVRAKVTFTGKCIINNATFSNELTVHIIDPATASVDITPTSVNGCTGDTQSFKANLKNLGIVTYHWTVNEQPAGTNSDTFESAALLNGDKVKCSVTSDGQCATIQAESNEVEVSLVTGINNRVTITSSAKDDIIEKGQQVTFNAQADVTNGVSYQWQVNGINVGTNSPVYTTNDLDLLDKVTCLIITPGSCPEGVPLKSNEITVFIVEPVKPPNTFTPNGDGFNDTWSIPALLGYPKCVVTIFNRNGSQVYQSIGYPAAWDGTRNGIPLPVGVYYYVINLNYQRQKISGSVTVLR